MGSVLCVIFSLFSCDASALLASSVASSFALSYLLYVWCLGVLCCLIGNFHLSKHEQKLKILASYDDSMVVIIKLKENINALLLLPWKRRKEYASHLSPHLSSPTLAASCISPLVIFLRANQTSICSLSLSFSLTPPRKTKTKEKSWPIKNTF